jgi:hypothetical protein
MRIDVRVLGLFCGDRDGLGIGIWSEGVSGSAMGCFG